MRAILCLAVGKEDHDKNLRAGAGTVSRDSITIQSQTSGSSVHLDGLDGALKGAQSLVHPTTTSAAVQRQKQRRFQGSLRAYRGSFANYGLASASHWPVAQKFFPQRESTARQSGGEPCRFISKFWATERPR